MLIHYHVHVATSSLQYNFDYLNCLRLKECTWRVKNQRFLLTLH